MATLAKTEWKDVTIVMKELAWALDKNQLSDALWAYDRLDVMLERWRTDMVNTVGDIQEMLSE